ncbi:MAG: DNA polymerase III subunit gamma/tau [Saezia sp.]
MSYIVLARQYRPKKFAEMVGQDHVVRALSNALKSQRLHHAYLFTGTRGVGKTTVSRILAKSLNCVGPDGQGGITNEPCGVCQACKDIDAGRFVDYVELDAASNRGVDEISKLLEQAVYKPVAGRFKVFMIDEVHMLSNTAFNAMLKTLEEPPEYLKFVLATTDPQKVPVTVLSRCLQFNLRSMAPETISEHLQQVLGQEKIHSDAGSLRLIARAARGSMRDALSLTDQAIAYGSGTIEEAAVRQMLGSVGQAHIYQLIQAIAQGQGRAVVELVDNMRMQSRSAKAALEEMANVLQRMAILRVAPQTAHTDDPDDAQIAALIPLLQPDEVQLLYSIVLHGQEELGLASDEYAAVIMILLRMLAFIPAQQTTNEPHPVLVAAEKKTELNTCVNATVSASAPVAQAPEKKPETFSPLRANICETTLSEKAESLPLASNDELRDKLGTPATQPVADDDLPPWVSEPLPDFEPQSAPSTPVTNLLSTATLPEPIIPAHKEHSASSKSELMLSEPTAQTKRWEEVVKHLTDNELVIALARELVLNAQVEHISQDEQEWSFKCNRQTLISESNQEKVKTAMLALLGHPVRLSFELGEVTETPALRMQAWAEKKQKEAEAAVAADPDIQKWLHEFSGAQMIPGSTRSIENIT